MQDKGELRVLMLINKDGYGGAEHVFAKQFEYFKSKGISTYLGTLQVGNIQFFSNSTCFNFKHLLDVGAFFRLLSFIRENKISVVYATLDHAIFISRCLKFFKPSVRIIIRESGMASRKSILMKVADVLLNFFINKIIAVSDEVRESLVRYQLFYSKKIVVIGNGVTPTLGLEKIIKERKADDKFFTILNVGSMNNPNKGQAGLLRLLKRLKSSSEKNWKLVLVGEGKLRDDLEKFAREMEIEQDVRFAGIVNHEEIGKEYIMADVFVLNSANEGSPNTVLEAMSYAVPVIATPVGGIDKVIEVEKTGWIINRDDVDKMAEKINMLSTDPTRKREMGSAGYKRLLNHFTFEDSADCVLNVLASK